MRLASHFRKTPADGRRRHSLLLSPAIQSNFSHLRSKLFNAVRLGGRGEHIVESNFDALITEARKVFKKSFPFGEDAANALTLKDRIMMKSERVSSQDKA